MIRYILTLPLPYRTDKCAGGLVLQDFEVGLGFRFLVGYRDGEVGVKNIMKTSQKIAGAQSHAVKNSAPDPIMSPTLPKTSKNGHNSDNTTRMLSISEKNSENSGDFEVLDPRLSRGVEEVGDGESEGKEPVSK